MTSREQFEAHIRATPFYGYAPEDKLDRDEDDGGYLDATLHGYWLSWLASRAALVIELPAPHTDYDNYRDSEVTGACKHYEAARKAINAAGIKVAP